MNRKLQVARYVIADFISALLAWGAFFVYRKYAADPNVFDYPEVIYQDANLLYGLLFIPLFWLCLYVMMGTYRRIYRKSRLRELGQTLLITVIGVMILFFALILDDTIVSYKNYYQSVLVLFALHFVPTYLLRLILTSITAYKIHHKLIGFNKNPKHPIRPSALGGAANEPFCQDWPRIPAVPGYSARQEMDRGHFSRFREPGGRRL